MLVPGSVERGPAMAMKHPHAGWTRDQAYIDTTETLTLEFKSIRALIADDRRDKDTRLKEAARDVAGMANEQGGYIIYGIEEEGHGAFRRAKTIEEGFGVEHKVPREWFLQFIRDRVQPPLSDIDAVDVPLDDERFALVVLVPEARGVARQTEDHLFWRRDAQGLRRMTVQEIEDVRLRLVRPVLDLRLPRSPGRVQGDLAEIEFAIEVHNASAATSGFAVVTLGLDHLTSASFPTNPEWRWEDTVGPWKIARTVIASGSSPRWSPITPGFTLAAQRFTLRAQLIEPDSVGWRVNGLLRLDHDGGAAIYRLMISKVDPDAGFLRLEHFDQQHWHTFGTAVPDLFVPTS